MFITPRLISLVQKKKISVIVSQGAVKVGQIDIKPNTNNYSDRNQSHNQNHNQNQSHNQKQNYNQNHNQNIQNQVANQAKNVNTNKSEPTVIHPINSLNPYNRRWTIKGRVTYKSELKTWNNARGSGQLFTFNLLDKQNGEIKITCFSEAADQFYELIESGRVYLVSKGQLKPAQKKFSTLKNPYEITLDKNSEVTPSNEDDDIPSINFDFIEISAIKDLTDEGVDVIGILFDYSPLTSFTTKAGKEMDKRVLTIVDTTNNKIELTLFGDTATTLQLPEVNNYPVIACKGVKVSNYSNKSLSSNYGNTTIMLDPDVREAVKLRSWFDKLSNMDYNNFVNLTDKSATGTSSSAGPAIPIFLGQLKDAVIRDPSLNSKTFASQGWITAIKHEPSEGAVKHPMFYKCCPTPECSKGVEEDTMGQYNCSKCAKPFPNHSWAYNVSFCVSDPIGNCWVSAFASAGALFTEEGQILKAPAMYQLYEQDIDTFNRIIYDACCRPVDLRVKAQRHDWNERPSVRVQADKLEVVDYKSGARDLLSRIHSLLEEETEMPIQ